MPRGRPPKPKESKARGDTGKRPRAGRAVPLRANIVPRCGAGGAGSGPGRGRRSRPGSGAGGQARAGVGAPSPPPSPPLPPPDCRVAGCGRNDTGAARPAPPPGWAYFPGPRGRAAGPGARRAPPPSSPLSSLLSSPPPRSSSPLPTPSSSPVLGVFLPLPRPPPSRPGCRRSWEAFLTRRRRPGVRPRGWRARPDRELPRPRGGARGGLGSGSPRGDTWAETVRGSRPGAPSSGPGLGGPASPSPEARDPGGRAPRVSEEKEVVSGKEGRCVRSILPLRRLGREGERLGVSLAALSVL